MRRILLPVACFALAAVVFPARSRPDAPRPVATPWGVSSSASAFRDHADWFPKMAEAGVTTVRLFPGWQSFEPKRGTWKWDHADSLVKNAAANGIEVNAILMGSAPGTKAAHAFPVDKLDEWSGFVSAVVGRYKKQVRYWEVWNEGNGGFNDARHATADYAKLAIAAYAAAKKADPGAQVGLTVASFDAPYLNQAALAMARAGKPNSFDYLCIHPYEIADGLAEPDGEIPFLWMTRQLRSMLKATAPDRADAEIWITEVGRLIEKKERPVTEQDAARSLAKIYVLSIAQGIARVQWFEARDPVGEQAGFGLLKRDGNPRPSYRTLKALTTLLGPVPGYEGWLALGREGRGYGFVFKGKDRPVLVAWMPAGETDESVAFAVETEVTDAASAVAATLEANRPLKLGDAPVLVRGLPAELAKQAKANAGKPFPWGGDWSAAKTASCVMGSPDASKGVFRLGRGRYPTVAFPDKSTGILVPGDIGHPVSFFVHPSFAKFQTSEYWVRATVRRVSGGNAGMNLLHEVADSQGRSPYANTGKWFGTTKDKGWQTHTWHVKGACFSKMWGYDLVVRPEESVPFVLGKVEVSTEPFK